MQNKFQTKRVVLVTNHFPKLSEAFIVHKFLELLKRGWNVHVVCKNSLDKDSFKDVYTQHQHRIHFLNPTSPKRVVLLIGPFLIFQSFILNFKVSLNYLKKGYQKWGLKVFKHYYLDMPILKLKPDMIHFEFGAFAPERIHLKEILKCKIVTSFRGYDLNFTAVDQPHYYRSVWKNSDAIHCLGEHLWQQALERGCPKDKFYQLIPPSIDLNQFYTKEKNFPPDLGSKSRPLHLLSVGRLNWKKGYEYSFQALKILKEKGIFFSYQIIGGGDYLEALSFTRHQLDLENEIIFLGPQNQDCVIEKLKWADVFLHSAVSEGFCNAVLEAQAMATPVITSDAGGLSENVEHGVTGFIVPRRSPEAIAEKIVELLNQRELLRSFSQQGPKRVAKDFSVKEKMDQFDLLYKKVFEHTDL